MLRLPRRTLLAGMLLVSGRALAQQATTFGFGDLSDALNRWMDDNLDEDVVRALREVDDYQLLHLFDQLMRRLEATNIYDLAPMEDMAIRLLPMLHENEATRPYALWLEAHLDYLRVAEELWRRNRPPQPRRGPRKPTPKPTPRDKRNAWEEEMKRRPMPPPARVYVPRLKPVFRSGHVPPELVWLAEVESSFNPEARSPVGAVGLFQFMPVTAKSLGLSLSPKDERMDPEKSAAAASKYLRYLYGRFRDWSLAMAGYNAGPTRVANLLKKHRARSFNGIAPYLPSETQLYVPKVEATLRKREGVRFHDLEFPQA